MSMADLSATFPAAKGVLRDRYAELAIFDQQENQKAADVVLEGQRRRKQEIKAALDAQIRAKQAETLRDREVDRMWLQLEQERIAVWNAEESKKRDEKKRKEDLIRSQRQQQLAELSLMRRRDAEERESYEQSILRGIQREISKERVAEVEKRRRDEENRRAVVAQNDRHKAHIKELKTADEAAMRALEKQWSEVLDQQERQRSRLLAATYARQARQYEASDSMQEVMRKKGAADEAKQREVEKQLSAAAMEKDRAQKAKRAQHQKECLEVLAHQVREKEIRCQAELARAKAIADHARAQQEREEEVERKTRQARRARNMAYADELKQQMQLQHERKTFEPYLLSKTEMLMNKQLLSQLPP